MKGLIDALIARGYQPFRVSQALTEKFKSATVQNCHNGSQCLVERINFDGESLEFEPLQLKGAPFKAGWIGIEDYNQITEVEIQGLLYMKTPSTLYVVVKPGMEIPPNPAELYAQKNP
ncbi:MAG: hypothetical protein V1837_00610 [Candidatus Woesearchaeota archaeon]